MVRRLGVMPYKQAWDLQKSLVRQRQANEIPDTLLLLQHPPVVTIGRNGHRSNVLVSDDMLAGAGVELVHSDRGGDVTFHGPGQIMGYPILDLRRYKFDLRWYVRQLEEIMIRTAAHYDVKAEHQDGFVGTWVGNDKLGAIGCRVSRGVTSHGFAFNVSTDLEYFKIIVPCGICAKGVTSLQRLLGRDLPSESVEETIIQKFSEVFQCRVKVESPAIA